MYCPVVSLKGILHKCLCCPLGSIRTNFNTHWDLSKAWFLLYLMPAGIIPVHDSCLFCFIQAHWDQPRILFMLVWISAGISPDYFLLVWMPAGISPGYELTQFVLSICSLRSIPDLFCVLLRSTGISPVTDDFVFDSLWVWPRVWICLDALWDRPRVRIVEIFVSSQESSMQPLNARTLLCVCLKVSNSLKHVRIVCCARDICLPLFRELINEK